MTTFQKPENALRRANDLADVGNKEDALALCGTVMGNRKFKNTNTINVMEKMAEFSLGTLAVELKELKAARDILINYRSMTQTSNAASLEKVVRCFRSAAEKKVESSRLDASALRGEDVEDLEALDTPDKALRKALQPKAVREQEKKEREVLENIRFLWETYKQILDVFKTNGRTEDLYNETAVRALLFCQTHKRTNEFKKLCDLLRQNYENLFRRMQSNGHYPPHAVNPTDPDTIRRTIETRCKQLQVAADMELWKECFNTAEALHALMIKKKPKPAILAQYYEFLSQICWKSSSFLFHAYASVRNYTLYKLNHKSLTAQAKQSLATIAVLATMCVNLSTTASHVEIYSAQQSEMEKLRRMATLFNVASIPTKETLKNDLLSREILVEATEAAQKLYQHLEMAPRAGNKSYYPKDLCAICKPLLDELAASTFSAPYVNQLRKVIFFRLLSQLSCVYSTMRVTSLKALVDPVVDFATAEKWMISDATKSGVHVQLNYVNATVVFANKTTSDLSTLQQPLITVAKRTVENLQKVVRNIEEDRKEDQRRALFSEARIRFDRESEDIEARVREIAARNQQRDQAEKLKAERKEYEEQQQKKMDQRNAQQRMQEEKAQRTKAAQEVRKRENDIRRMQEIVEDMKKIYFDLNPKILGYQLNDIGEDQLQELDLERLIDARDNIIMKERAEKVRQRKMESKRIDHLARAIRESEAQRIPGFASSYRSRQEADFAQIHAEQEAAARAEHEDLIERKRNLQEYKRHVHVFLEEHIGRRQLEYQEKLKEKQKREWEKKCDRAIQKYYFDLEEQERLREQEEREREEREIREKEEEEERKRQEERVKREEERRKIREAEEAKRAEERAKAAAAEERSWRDDPPKDAGRNSNMGGRSSMGDRWRQDGDGDRSTDASAKGGPGGKRSSGGKGSGDFGDLRRQAPPSGGGDRDFGNLRDRGGDFGGKDGGRNGTVKGGDGFDNPRGGNKGGGFESMNRGGENNASRNSKGSFQPADRGTGKDGGGKDRDGKGHGGKGQHKDRDMDNWRPGGGPGGPSSGFRDRGAANDDPRGFNNRGAAPAAENTTESTTGERPVPAWKKYAQEKKAQEQNNA